MSKVKFGLVIASVAVMSCFALGAQARGGGGAGGNGGGVGGGIDGGHGGASSEAGGVVRFAYEQRGLGQHKWLQLP